jgi:CheY-like chemotaxis protein
MPPSAISHARQPAVVSPPAVSHEEGSPRRPIRGHVLVADDSHVTRTFVSRLLEIADFAVDVAVDGQTCTLAACTEQYDLVLMDLEMPVINGVEATRVIRAAGLSVPIIALTASCDRTVPRLCAEAGMNGFLQKPFTLAVFEMEWERVRLLPACSDPGCTRPVASA